MTVAGACEAGSRDPASSDAAPRNPGALFRRLARLDPGAPDLARLFDGVDLSDATPLHVYRSVLNRAPERLWQADPAYDAKAHFLSALQSPEFRFRAIELFAAAFPEKRRLIFVHVPKCAGTDLRRNLAPRLPSLPHLLASEAWTPADAFFGTLAACARGIEESGAFLVYGHIELDDYLERIAVGLDDRIFTIVRDPVEIAASLANYQVSMMVMDPRAETHHTREAYARLGLERLPDGADPATLNALARRALAELTPPNPICSHLASAGKGFAAAVRNIVTHDIEVTDTARYNDWLADAWGIRSTSRHNQSTKFLTPSDIAAQRGRLDPLLSEDRRLFELLAWALASAGTPSIRGSRLPELLASRPGPYRYDVQRDEIVGR